MKKMYENKKLEEEINEIVDKKYDFEEILQKHNSYEYFYYLSRLRENLFVWYPFKEDACLLELGGSYGALTNLFCKKVKEVVSIEDSYEKANIISKRCNADNLKVLVNDFSEIEQLYEKFDYIVMTDFFEYAKIFHKSSNPFKIAVVARPISRMSLGLLRSNAIASISSKRTITLFGAIIIFNVLKSSAIFF